MADVYGVNYEKEWVNDPAEQAAKGTRNAHIKNQYEELSGVAAADVLYLCKLQEKARFLGLEALNCALGAGDVKAIDKDGNETVLAAGDEVDGQVEGGLDIVLVADGATDAALKLLVRFLKD